LLTRDACDGEHVIEGHRDVGHDDLGDRLAARFRLRRRRSRRLLSGNDVSDDIRRARLAHRTQLPPELPANPEQKDAAGEQQSDDLKELRRHGGERDTQNGGRQDADEDRLAALVARQAGGRQADDDGIVAGQNEIDDDNLQEGSDNAARKEVPHRSTKPCPEDGGHLADGFPEPTGLPAAIHPGEGFGYCYQWLIVRQGRTNADRSLGFPVRHHSSRELPEGPGLGLGT